MKIDWKWRCNSVEILASLQVINWNISFTNCKLFNYSNFLTYELIVTFTLCRFEIFVLTLKIVCNTYCLLFLPESWSGWIINTIIVVLCSSEQMVIKRKEKRKKVDCLRIWAHHDPSFSLQMIKNPLVYDQKYINFQINTQIDIH